MDRRKVIAIAILLLCLLLNVMGPAAQTIPSLLHSTTLGDFNGDGILDVAVVDQGAVSILLGQGQGVFQAPVLVPAGLSPVAVISGDFNGDGITDLATANNGSGGSISILLGQGNGAFSSNEEYSVGLGPTRVISADMNGDGNLDLATTNAAGRSVSILTGRGDGTFQRLSDIPVGSTFEQVGMAVGDFNGDNLIDLAIANRVGLDILLGTGDGNFSLPTTAGNMSAWDVVAADLNGDRVLDLAAISVDGITPMFGRGDGTFQSEAILSSGLESNQRRPLIAADFNRDGIIDLAASGDNLSVLVGRGDGAFESSLGYPMGRNIRSLSPADFNSDGLLDFAIQTDKEVAVVFQAQGSLVNLSASPNPAETLQTVTLTATVSSAAGGVQMSSSFPGAAENPLSEGGKWVSPVHASVAGAIQKNAVGEILPAAAGPFTMARFVGFPFSGDQFSQATIANRNGNTIMGVAVRVQSNTDASAYALLAKYNTHITIVRLGDRGGFLQMVSPALMSFPVAPQIGDVLRLQIHGNTLTAFRNGAVLGSYTDVGTVSDWSGTYPPLTGGMPGVFMSVASGNAVTSARFKLWSGGDLFASIKPSGTVTFKDGATSLGSDTLDASGQASLDVDGLAVGTHPITAVYAGDGVYDPATSAIVNQVVSPKLSFTALSSSPNPSAVGQLVVLTAAVTTNTGVPPGGTVVFRDNGTFQLGTASVNATTGLGVLSLTNLAGGSHSITAHYFANAGYSASDSTPVIQVVNATATTTTVASSSNPSAVGQSVTFTAAVSSASGIPGGTVTFMDGATSLGTGALAAGQATFTTSVLGVGTHPITAVYGGGGVYAGSTSAALSQVISPPLTPTSTALTSSLNPSTTGQSVNFTASVTSSGGTPTGTVTFKNGAATLGAVALNGAGQAAFATSSLIAGSHPITAVYGGNATLASSTSPVVNQTVTASGSTPTATLLSSSLNPSNFGQSITLSALVSAGAGGAVVSSSFPAPAENPLSEDNTWVTPVNANATAAVQKNGVNGIYPAVTAKRAVARYVGTPLTADQFSQATISARNGSSTEGVAVRIQSNTNASGYALLDVYGQYVLARMADRGNELRFISPFLASFGGGALAGDVIRLEIRGSVNPTLTAYKNGVLLGSYIDVGVSDWSGNYPPLAGGQPGVLVFMSNGGVLTNARLNNWSGGDLAAGSSPLTGSVTFKEGATVLGTTSVNGLGQASMSTSALVMGTHPLTAVYNGDSSNASSTSPVLSQVVNAAGTTTALISSPNPSTSGQNVVFTATVTGSNGVPTGLVSFMDGATTLGTSTLNGAGVATYSSALTTGTHPMTAVYIGDANLTGSTSPVLNQVVNQGTQTETSTMTLTSNLNPSKKGQIVTFTATVTPSAGVAAGTVSFKDGANPIGSATLDGLGQASLAVTLNSVTTHVITANWTGTAIIAGSSASLNQVVDRANTLSGIERFESPNPSYFGQNVTFRITITSGAGQPVANVRLMDNGTTQVGAGGPVDGKTHTYITISTLGGGPHSITAVFDGDAEYLPSTSAPLSHSVTAGVSTTSVASSLNPSGFGQTITFSATVFPPNVGGTVTFMAGSSSLGTGTVNAGLATLATAALPMGNHSITAVYSGDSNVAGSTSAAITQVVGPPATATSVVSSVNPSLTGDAVTFTATVASLSAGTPNGSVTFNDGATLLATVNLNGAGQAAYSTSLLGTGSHPITVVYAGNAGFTGSSSAVLDQLVINANRVGTTTSVISSLNPSLQGQAVTFTATVSSAGGGVGQVTSNFPAPAQNPLNESGKWSTPVNAAAAVAFQKDATGRAHSTVVNRDALARITATLSENQYAQATITSRNGNTIEGVAVRVQSDGSGYALVDVNGTNYRIVRMAPNGNDIRFSGGSIATFAMTPVSGHVIRLEVAGSPIPTLKAYVNGVLLGTATDPGRSDWAGTFPPLTGGLPGIYAFVSSGALTGASLGSFAGGDLASGTVTFKDGATTLGTAVVDATGKATFTTSALAQGSHSITAVYGGDANFIGSTSPVLNQVVNVAAGSLFNLESFEKPVQQALAGRRENGMIGDERRVSIRRSVEM